MDSLPEQPSPHARRNYRIPLAVQIGYRLDHHHAPNTNLIVLTPMRDPSIFAVNSLTMNVTLHHTPFNTTPPPPPTHRTDPPPLEPRGHAPEWNTNIGPMN